MMRYQLIEPDGTEGTIYQGEQGRIYCQRYCRQNPGWGWRELDNAPVIELGINNVVHKSKADT